MTRQATLYRMVTGSHTCPSGLKARDLLRRHGYSVDDRVLTTREETDAFKAEHMVRTTPQVFVDGRRIGGYDDLRRHLGIAVPDAKALTYKPVVAVFAVTALMALATSQAAFGDPFTPRAAQWFIAFSMCVLAILKLQNVENFSSMFLGYDLLARRWVPYAYIYAFAEALAGILMVSGTLTWLSVPIALFIGGIGAVSVVKAVYIEGRALKCACVGGGNVPLGFVSLTENVMMVGMAIWMVAVALPGTSHAASPAGMSMAQGHGPAGRAFMQGMERMNKDMMAPMSGDPDRDFAAMMIAHHQGAIDMARVELRYGKDPVLRELAEDVVKAQETEIATMKAWQAQHAR